MIHVESFGGKFLINHEQFMLKALEQARLAEESGEVPVGAVVVYNSQIVAACHNLRETLGDPTAHAEILALREAARLLGTRRLSGCSMYVTLEPCPMCAGAIVMAKLDTCCFAAWDEKQGCCGSVYDIPQDPAFSHRTKVIGGILEEESKNLLKRFFTQKRV